MSPDLLGAPAGVWPRALRALVRAGVLAPVRPDRLLRMGGAALELGLGPATGVAAGAARHPDQVAIADELGTVTFVELDRRAARIAAALGDDYGVGPDRSLAIMCRNHRCFAEAFIAGSRLGADLLLLNTDFPGPQLAQVIEREQPGAAIFDEEFAPAFEEAKFAGAGIVAWHDGEAAVTLDALASRTSAQSRASRHQGSITLLTSGTTGTPKGAPRKPSAAAMVGPMTTLLEHVPLRSREAILVAPPLFHAFGLAGLGLGLLLGSKVVTARRFEPEAALAAIEQHNVTAMIAVPVMLERIMRLPDDVRARYDTSSLGAVFCGAAQLTGSLSNAFMDEFGDILYNGYGSTETGFGAIARPADLRAAPGTVGRPPYGSSVAILDADRRPLPDGETGHVFIGGPLIFEGYSGGGSKETANGLMNTGDLGHIDAEGRLFIDGREDDMIVSGGENVFPQEVVEVLLGHDAVEDAAVFGVDDEEFGQRLRAYVVASAGREPSPEELKAHVKANLARYKVPRDFVLVDELPRTPTGKVQRKRLEELAPPAS